MSTCSPSDGRAPGAVDSVSAQRAPAATVEGVCGFICGCGDEISDPELRRCNDVPDQEAVTWIDDVGADLGRIRLEPLFSFLC